jgi:hypothetical protein
VKIIDTGLVGDPIEVEGFEDAFLITVVRNKPGPLELISYFGPQWPKLSVRGKRIILMGIIESLKALLLEEAME